jgi:hypothetical protein
MAYPRDENLIAPLVNRIEKLPGILKQKHVDRLGLDKDFRLMNKSRNSRIAALNITCHGKVKKEDADE